MTESFFSKDTISEKGRCLRGFVGNLVKCFRKTTLSQTFKRLLLRSLGNCLISSTGPQRLHSGLHC